MTEPRKSFWKRLPRLRLSLRMMMLAVLVFGGGLGWYIAGARRQAGTVAAIRRIGGDVSYDWEYRDGQLLEPTAEPPWPDWLIQRLGPDFFRNVTVVSVSSEPGQPPESTPGWMLLDDGLIDRICELSHVERLDFPDNKRFTDAQLSRLSKLTRIRVIHLDHSGVSGPGLVHLKNMTRLEVATLKDLPIRDADLANLSGLISLKDLEISGELLTDAGLAHLSPLKNMESIYIDSGKKSTAITSNGLAHLSSLHKLDCLSINNSNIESLEPIRHLVGLTSISFSKAHLDDVGLAALSNLGSLIGLRLEGNPKITDSLLPQLSGLNDLHTLDLDDCSITDAGLRSLATLPALRRISLNGTKVTPAGIAELQAKRRGLFIN